MTPSAMANELKETGSVLFNQCLNWQRKIATIHRTINHPRLPIVMGRGSSGHAAVALLYFYAKQTGLHGIDFRPSLVDMSLPKANYSGFWGAVFSASGESPELLRAAEWLKSCDASLIGITNGPADCSLSRLADDCLCLSVGAERAIPATKSFSAQLLAAGLLAGLPLSDDARLALPKLATILDSPAPSETATWLENCRMVIWLGRGWLLPAALDAALKLQETSGHGSVAYSIAEYFHGPIGSSHRDDRVIVFDDRDAPSPLAPRLFQTLEQRQVPFITVTPQALWQEPHFTIPPILKPVILTTFAQSVALSRALQLKLNPDKPESLAKVTRT